MLNNNNKTIIFCLFQCSLEHLFANCCILEVFRTSLKERVTDSLDIMPVIKAFESLQHYILLLVDQPWKPEYKRLKVRCYNCQTLSVGNKQLDK